MKIKNFFALAAMFSAVFSFVFLAGQGTVLAQSDANVSITASSSVSTSTRASLGLTELGKRYKAWQSKGAKEIDMRIKSLSDLSAKIKAMRNITAADKNVLNSTVLSISNGLSAFKEKAAVENSATLSDADIQSTNQAYRVYSLLIPQISIIASVDKVKTLINQMTTVAGKIQSRLAASTTFAENPTVKKAMADFTTELNLAATNAGQALETVMPLQPDMGDKTIMAGNTAALKAASAKIKAAEQALIAAGKDLQAMVKVVTSANAGASGR